MEVGWSLIKRVVDQEIKEPTRNLDLEKFTEKNEKLPLGLQKEPPYLKKCHQDQEKATPIKK